MKMKILIDAKGKKYPVNDEDLHTNRGYIKKEDIAGSSEGQVLETHMGHKFTVIKASINDYIDLMGKKMLHNITQRHRSSNSIHGTGIWSKSGGGRRYWFGSYSFIFCKHSRF